MKTLTRAQDSKGSVVRRIHLEPFTIRPNTELLRLKEDEMTNGKGTKIFVAIVILLFAAGTVFYLSWNKKGLHHKITSELTLKEINKTSKVISETEKEIRKTSKQIRGDLAEMRKDLRMVKRAIEDKATQKTKNK